MVQGKQARKNEHDIAIAWYTDMCVYVHIYVYIIGFSVKIYARCLHSLFLKV